MSDVIPFNQQTQLPAELLDVFGDSSAEDLMSGGGGYPVISIRGSKFRIKTGGDEQPLINKETGDPMPSLELVVIASQKGMSKIWYEKNYVEGDNEAPDCYSNSGDKPASDAVSPQSSNCATCPKNAWGSKVSESGVESKACGDSKRLAVTFASNLPNKELGGPMLLRVPAASLKDLTRFARGMAAKGFKPQQIAMRVGFDMDASYPKLTFKAVRALNLEEVGVIAELYKSDEVDAITGESHVVAPAPKAAPAPKKKDAVDLDFDDAPAEAPVPVVAAEPKKKKAPAKKAPAKKADPAPAADVPLDEHLDDVLANLDSIEV